MNKLSTFDYVVLFLVLAASIIIGVYHSLVVKIKSWLKDKSGGDEEESDAGKVHEYLTAKSSMGILPITFSLMASFFSATGLIGTCAEVYQYGIPIWIVGFSFCSTSVLGAFVTGPFFSKLGILSTFEYFELRYPGSKWVKRIGNICFALRTLIFLSIIQLGPVVPMSFFMDLSQNLTIILIGVIGTLYTSLGGIRGVIWCDLFQSFIMIGTVILLSVKGALDSGGFFNVIAINERGGRLDLLDYNPDPFVRQSFWSLIFGASIYFSINYCFDQQMLQRFNAAKTKQKAQIALLLNIPIVVVFISACCFLGLVLYASFETCDPFYSKKISSFNAYSSYFVYKNLGAVPGSYGLFLAAIFCSALSSLSSALNSLTLVIWKDFFLTYPYFHELSEGKKLTWNKLIVAACGIASTVICYLMSLVNVNLSQLANSLTGAMNAPLIGLFVLSMFFSCTNHHGAIAGALFGLSMNLWISMGAFIFKPVYPRLNVSVESCLNESMFYNASSTSPTSHIIRFDNLKSNLHGLSKIYSLGYWWYTPFGALNCIIVGLVVSVLTGGLKHKIDRSLIVCDLFEQARTKRFAFICIFIILSLLSMASPLRLGLYEFNLSHLDH